MTQTIAVKRKPYTVDLSALMAVCETNYWRLQKLLPLFNTLEKHAEFQFIVPSITRDNQSTDLAPEREMCLRIIERCPYTTTLEFSEHVSNQSDTHLLDKQLGLSPKLTVRIYHDAKTAEVIAFQGQRHFMGIYPYPNPQMRQRDEKYQLNHLLAGWLDHCLTYGYSYS